MYRRPRLARVLKTLLVVVLLSVGAYWFLPRLPGVETQPDGLKPFMKRKLELSKNVVEALVTEDYEKLAKNAQGLSLLSMESGWNVFTTGEYVQQSADFRRAVQVIIDASHEKNIDRAALGYVNLTVRCVECHKYLRKHHPSVSPKAD